MYVLVQGGVARSYSVTDLRRDNPQTSFPKTPGEALLAEWGIFPLKRTEQPAANPTKNITEGAPAQQAGEWVQTWVITAATPAEVMQRAAQQAEQVSQQRQAAYVVEADPLFFKAQRGEVALSDWLAKVNEIKARFPDAASA